MEWGGRNGGNPLILLPLTSLRHTSVSLFFISSHPTLCYPHGASLQSLGHSLNFLVQGLCVHIVLSAFNTLLPLCLLNSFISALSSDVSQILLPFRRRNPPSMLPWPLPYLSYHLSLDFTTLSSAPSMRPDTWQVLSEYLFNEYIKGKREYPYRHSLHFPFLTGQTRLITKLYSLNVTPLSLYFSFPWITD